MTLALNTTRSEPDGVTVRNIALAGVAAMLAPLPATIIAALTDPHTFNGGNAWLKPMHFELSIAIHLATLALLVPLLSDTWQRSRLIRWTMLISVFANIAEVIYISLQAARGEASHFNQTSQLAFALYGLMGLGAVLIVLGSGVFGYGIWRSPTPAGSPNLHRGAALGLMLGSGATLLLAGYLSQQAHGHWVGGPQTDAFGLPFLGWATRGGDLRVPHFFATHAMQALPLAGLAADRLGLARTNWLMPAAAGLYFAGVLALFVQAVMGVPLIAT